MAEFKMFPKEHVWVPSSDGKFYQRSVQPKDEKRRGLVERLLSRPLLPRNARLSKEERAVLQEEKMQIRLDLERLPKPWELED